MAVGTSPFMLARRVVLLTRKDATGEAIIGDLWVIRGTGVVGSTANPHNDQNAVCRWLLRHSAAVYVRMSEPPSMMRS